MCIKLETHRVNIQVIAVRGMNVVLQVWVVCIEWYKLLYFTNGRCSSCRRQDGWLHRQQSWSHNICSTEATSNLLTSFRYCYLLCHPGPHGVIFLYFLGSLITWKDGHCTQTKRLMITAQFVHIIFLRQDVNAARGQ